MPRRRADNFRNNKNKRTSLVLPLRIGSSCRSSGRKRCSTQSSSRNSITPVSIEYSAPAICSSRSLIKFSMINEPCCNHATEARTFARTASPITNSESPSLCSRSTGSTAGRTLSTMARKFGDLWSSFFASSLSVAMTAPQLL